MSAADYERKDVWSRHGENFGVEINRFTRESHFDDRGVNRWCVYAFVRKGHRLFSTIQGGSTSQESLYGWPLHGGCTYLVGYTEGTEVYGWKVGADYSHLYDDRFYRMATLEQAWEVVKDADELFRWLSPDAAVEMATITSGTDADGCEVSS